MKTINVIAIGSAGISAMVAIAARGQMDTTSSSVPKEEDVVDEVGNLRVPNDYRSTYQSLGSWAVAADQGQGSKELHIVYASPGTVTAYRKDGHFPDGAVLVKEVFEARTRPMTTGTVSHAETLKGWFVMVKDSNGRHPGNKLWGDGWGWSWFDAGNPSKTTSTDYKANCLPCHVPAQASDWVYVGGYPPLRRQERRNDDGRWCRRGGPPTGTRVRNRARITRSSRVEIGHSRPRWKPVSKVAVASPIF